MRARVSIVSMNTQTLAFSPEHHYAWGQSLRAFSLCFLYILTLDILNNSWSKTKRGYSKKMYTLQLQAVSQYPTQTHCYNHNFPSVTCSQLEPLSLCARDGASGLLNVWLQWSNFLCLPSICHPPFLCFSHHFVISCSRFHLPASDMTSAWLILLSLHHSAQKHLSSYRRGKNKRGKKRLQLQGGYCTFGLNARWRSSWLHTGATFVWHQQIEALELHWTRATRLARPLSHMGDLASFKLAQMSCRANRRSNRIGPFMTSAFFPSVQLLHSI